MAAATSFVAHGGAASSDPVAALRNLRTPAASGSFAPLSAPLQQEDAAGLQEPTARGQQFAAAVFAGALCSVARRHGVRPRKQKQSPTAVATAALGAPAGGAASDLAVRGVLPNGLRYVVMNHKVPPGRLEAHIVIHAGSVDEDDQQQGMAHMLEHICFLGSEKRQELQSTNGVTSNALTDFQHTVYHLSMNTEDLGPGLDALAEIAFTPAFEEQRVEKERAAVLSEAKMTNDCQYRIQTQILGTLHAENAIHKRFPIGLEEQIASWSRDELRAFHSKWYVPENSTLYIVGDVTADSAAAEISRAFGSVHGNEAQEDPWLTDSRSLYRPALQARAPVLHSFVQTENPLLERTAALASSGWNSELKVQVATNELVQGLQFCWAAKLPLQAVTSADGLLEWLQGRIVVEALRVRLQARWRGNSVPCAFHMYDSPREGSALTTLTIASEPSLWEVTCGEVLREVLAVSRYGVTDEEVERAKRMLLRRTEEAASTQPWALMGTLHGHDVKATSREIVEELIGAMPCGHLLTRADAFHEALLKASANVTSEQVNQTARQILSPFGGAASPRGAVAVSCPATVTTEHNGQKVPFQQPSAEDVVKVLSHPNEMTEEEAFAKVITVPTSLIPLPEPVPPVERTELPGGVVRLKLANGLRVRLLVQPGSADGGVQNTMRLTVPGGRATESVLGAPGSIEAGLRALAGCGVGEYSEEQVQLYQQLNSVSTGFQAATNQSTLDLVFANSADSASAALQWLHCFLRAPKMDLSSFNQAQLRMKGDAHAREKNMEGQALSVLKQEMYPNDRWMWDPMLMEVNQLTLGRTREVVMSQLRDYSQLELDIAATAASMAPGSGLSHDEESGAAEDSSGAVAELREMLEREVCRALGPLPATGAVAPPPPTPKPVMTYQGCERRLHVPDADARAIAYIAGGAPGYWGKGDAAWEDETSSRGFSWSSSHPLYAVRSMELMIECLNARLLGRVRDQLSLTYSCEVNIAMYDGFEAGNFICRVSAVPPKLEQATIAALEVLRSPGFLPFRDMEIDGAKKVLAFRMQRFKREQGHMVERLRQAADHHNGSEYLMHALLGDAAEQELLDAIGTDDVQKAWGGLTGLDDPVVVCATSGPPQVASVLPPYEIVQNRIRRPARPDFSSEVMSVPSASGGGMMMLD
eukprot:TRINITY_DN51391_c0_g2_i1.p1 TRINITY_DN51391_c0_g2~~TRINITY_DN51391_c0_g2_i1.p1  ORF type:complete len:1159 (-),score=248.42 TRINITY_DN51391_c0_g2_i1:103-3579(-)